jgi:small-conductance mechanosensitive channel
MLSKVFDSILGSAFSDSFQDSVLGLLTIFFITLSLIIVFIILFTSISRRWLKRKSALYQKEFETKGEHNNFFGIIIREKGIWLSQCFIWFRYSTIFFITATLTSQLLTDIRLEALQKSQYKTISNLISKLTTVLDVVWLKGWKLFLFSFFGIVVGNLIGDAIRYFIKVSVIEHEQNNHSRAALRAKTLESTSIYLIRILIFILISLFCLQSLGLSIGPLLATAGVASVAIGFGAQSLVKDLFAGVCILLEDQFAVGDVIEVNGKSGQVESMTFRITRLRTADGSLLVIPNGEMKLVRNATSMWARVDFKIKIPLVENPSKCIEILKEACLFVAEHQSEDILGEPEFLGIDKLEDGYATYRFWLKTISTKRNVVERALNEQALKKLTEHGIRFTLPLS